MTIYDLANYYINPLEEMEIWDIDNEKTLFNGSFVDVKKSKYSDCVIGTFGIENGKIVINI